MIHEETTDRILKGFFKVYNTLGFGFLEKVYENALVIELAKLGLEVNQQPKIPVYYDGLLVGEYFADIVVQDVVILELKAAEALRDEYYAQLTNYLKASDKELGLLLNFGKKPQFKRIIFSNDVKQALHQGQFKYGVHL
ncbi:GxxExxY protein [Geomonas propionica]|uniref:GxxExxY protein n=1 Tax=Geomonas propionica TaxID=2798582 RepID=A0ABS0YLL0_9BACT|nr:GxxExxY protein [Geomonas propionica]MBJ6798837.1 GxxExxY protein [Geomonas propionica]